MNTHLPLNAAQEAVLEYAPNDFSIIRGGKYVRCAVTNVAIPLEHLRYWSVSEQEAYASPEAILIRLRQDGDQLQQEHNSVQS